jgi:hypothetical protein
LWVLVALKAKIDLVGPKACNFLDMGDTKTGAPETFKGREVVRSVHTQKGNGGLVIDVVAMKYGEAKASEQPNWWAQAAP